ncbi:hypothetical protein ATCVMO0605SPH_216L [Acanthocystis turfacea Chlorella virus MO0605SPH]|nr:hypothetical protein ATCVMO0605SPH_216L [Acanthocystis turfacea Chlorella virus MO0605SPH]
MREIQGQSGAVKVIIHIYILLSCGVYVVAFTWLTLENKFPIQFRAAISEQTPQSTETGILILVKRSLHETLHVERLGVYTAVALWIATNLRRNSPLIVRNKRPTVKIDFRATEALATDAVGHGDGNPVCSGMPLDSPRPVEVRLAIREVRLAADRSGHHDEVRAKKRQDARDLGKPLVPANCDSNLSKLGVCNAKLVVARAEVELLVVARSLRNMRLAIDARNGTIHIRNHYRVVVFVVVLFKEGHDDDDPELSREVRKPGHHLGLLVCLCEVKPLATLLLAEVLHTEELGQDNDLCAVGCRIPRHVLGSPQVLVEEPGHGELEDGNGGSHCNVEVRTLACILWQRASICKIIICKGIHNARTHLASSVQVPAQGLVQECLRPRLPSNRVGKEAEPQQRARAPQGARGRKGALQRQGQEEADGPLPQWRQDVEQEHGRIHSCRTSQVISTHSLYKV